MIEYKKIPIDYQDIEENFSQKLTEKKETPSITNSLIIFF